MCGIAGFYLIDPEGVDADQLLEEMLDEIEYRGGDACGFVAIGDKGVLEWQKAACDVVEFNAYRRRVPKGTRIVICHTRLATQGLAAFIENNHPIRRGPMYVIHNGHVTNDDELFKKAGRRRYGQVDSEAIAALLAQKDSLEATSSVMERIEGQAAIAAVDERNPNLLALARGNGSPLYTLVTRRVILFGSTLESVVRPHRKVIGSIKNNRAVAQPEGTTILVKDGHIQMSTFKPKVTTYGKSWLKRWESEPASTFISQSTEKVADYLDALDIEDDEADDKFSVLAEDLLRDSFAECDECDTWVHSEDMTTMDIGGEAAAVCATCFGEWDAIFKEDGEDINKYVLDHILPRENELDYR